MHRSHLRLAALFVLLLTGPIRGQEPANKKLSVSANDNRSSRAVEFSETERRAFGISILTSLANEARSYQNEASRAVVLARAADTLWPSDNHGARTFFRLAWEAAEKADKEKQSAKSTLPAMAQALQQSSGRDLRAEVLTLIARRDPALGEEYLAKLAEQAKRDETELKSDANTSDGWSSSSAFLKRLIVARKLLAEGEPERAFELAAPALNSVNVNSIGFLTALRLKRPQIADQSFAALLSRTELDPSSDANTVSGLSSYAFTPQLYVTFSAEGGARWSQLDEIDTSVTRPQLPASLLAQFFRTASNVLLRPLPSPDVTSSGHRGKSLVMQRLLPLFEQHAPDMAKVLRAKLVTLTNEPGRSVIGENHDLLTQGIQPNRTADELLNTMQEQLDRAKNSRERDLIYGDAAAKLAQQGTVVAQDLISKIDDAKYRTQAGRYVHLVLIQFAIKKRQAAEVLRLAKAESLTHAQRAWAFTQAAHLLVDSDRQEFLRIMEEAANEARRVDDSDADRARSLVAVASQLITADTVRAWELIAEAVKAANSTPELSGTGTTIRYVLLTSSGLKMGSIDSQDFSLATVFRSLAKDDLYRSLDLAKNLKSEAPRATATIAIASHLLEPQAP